jgi:hypothetical protein
LFCYATACSFDLKYEKLVWNSKYFVSDFTESAWLVSESKTIGFSGIKFSPSNCDIDSTARDFVLEFSIEERDYIWIVEVISRTSLLTYLSRFGSLVGISVSLHAPLRTLGKYINNKKPALKSNRITWRFFLTMFIVLASVGAFFGVLAFFAARLYAVDSQFGSTVVIIWECFSLILLLILLRFKYVDVMLAIFYTYSTIFHVVLVSIAYVIFQSIDPFFDVYELHGPIQLYISIAAFTPSYLICLVTSTIWFLQRRNNSVELSRLLQ